MSTGLVSRRPEPHVYAADGIPFWPGGMQGCRHCPLPPKHPVHTMPERDDDEKALEARRLGEEVE